MEFDQSLHSVKSVRAKYPTSLLENPNLISNEKYSFLKNKLLDFYANLNSSHLMYLHYHITPTFQKQLYVNLHLILTEIVLTTDKLQRQDLLEDVYKWYLRSIGISKIENPSSKKLVPVNLKPLKPFAPVQKLKKKNKKFENKHSFVYFPKKSKSKTPDKLTERYTNHYNKMVENEKISFNVPLNRGFYPRTPTKQITETSFIDQEKEEPIQFKKIPSRTPEIPHENFLEKDLINPVKDLRKLCHKFRIIKPVIVNKDKEQILYSEADEIDKIKQKMAKKGLPVDLKAFEYGLCINQKVKLNSSSQKRLPVGGELLLKSPFTPVNQKIPPFPKKKKSL